MCTVVILGRPGHAWPLLLAANRDELRARPARPPGRHWQDRPEVVAGLDLEGGGSWLGINDHGLIAAVLNRDGSLGPERGKRSRGELVLEALDHAEAGAAAGALADLHPDAYRPFNLIVADPRDCYWLRHGEDGEIRVHPVPAGLHMLASTELDDMAHPRISRFLPEFRSVAEPDPELGDWSAWTALLQRRNRDPAAEPAEAMNLADMRLDGHDFGTLCSSLIGLPAYPGFHQHPVFLHADGPPDRARFESVELGFSRP